ncbi:hypothetical protein [Demequina lignilytica]|uniref:TadE-like protein n=1 Tax=Demequina lignilytica TaxID=3051663 RepID=A0AB35MJE1_9MICO|nr:hypothetical protein [Demequina sp. SYSU T0a273]MDN4483841.1 hypothetical protein [Demequina sp. SYSU T0a273]
MRSRRGDRGSVTVELALALPAAVAVLALALGAVRAAGEGAAVDAAALAAARAAVVVDDADAQAVARRVGGPRVSVEIVRADGWVAVTVEAPSRWPWPPRTAVIALPDQP